MTIPYTFATQSGNVPASELDANFIAVNAGSSANPFLVASITATGVITSPSFVGALTGNATSATTAVSATSATSSTNIAGGLAGSIPYQASVGSTTLLPVGAITQVLTVSNSGIPSWAAPLSGGMTNPMTTSGAMIYGTTGGAPATLVAGTNGQILQTNGTAAPTWVSSFSGTSALTTNIAGGGTNQISYQSATNITAFISTPTTASTYLQWSGTSFVWQAITAYNPAAVAITGGTIDGVIIGSATPTAGNFTLLNATTSGATTTVNVTDTGTYGANIKLTGNGATTPNKYIRSTNGQLQFVNSAYSNPVAYMDDLGNFTALSLAGIGTNLTGTAALLNIGGNAATATLAATATNALNAMGRNVMINGDQVISQVNGTTAITPLNGTYIIDMVGIGLSQPSKVQTQQQFGPLTALGATGSLTTTVATSYIAAATEGFYQYRGIEGYNFQRFEYGTANAKAASLQFKVRASVGGTYSGAISNGTRSYVFSYVVAANSDTLVQIPNIPGDTAGTWTAFTSPTAVAAYIFFDLGGGTSTKAAVGGWQTGNYNGVNNATNLVSQAAGSTLTYTDVQFELGAFCTTFERKLYGPNLTECQRYLYVAGSGGSGSRFNAGTAFFSSTTAGFMFEQFPVPMRASPTITYISPGSFRIVGDSFQGNSCTLSAQETNNLTATHAVALTGATTNAGGIVQSQDSTAPLIIHSAQL